MPEEGVESPGAGVIGDCGVPMVGMELGFPGRAESSFNY